MLGTRNVSELSKSFILSRLTESEIFRFYCPSFTQLGKKFSSELRTDNDPSCSIIQMPSGRLIYRDHKESVTMTCFQYVQRKFLCTEDEALNIIAADFSIRTRTVITPSLNYVGLADLPLRKHQHQLTKIPIRRRPWNEKDVYWKQYHITQEMLDLYNVLPLGYMWTQFGDELHLTYRYKPEDPAYSYEHGKGMRKILRPYTSRDKKWRSNIPRHIFSGWDQLEPEGEVLVITKSLKDVMVWRMAGINSISPQGESIRLTEGLVNLLHSRYQRILVNYDNDAAGLQNMALIKEEFGLEGFTSPAEKDISDFVKAKGFNATTLKQIIHHGT